MAIQFENVTVEVVESDDDLILHLNIGDKIVSVHCDAISFQDGIPILTTLGGVAKAPTRIAKIHEKFKELLPLLSTQVFFLV